MAVDEFPASQILGVSSRGQSAGERLYPRITPISLRPSDTEEKIGDRRARVDQLPAVLARAGFAVIRVISG